MERQISQQKGEILTQNQKLLAERIINYFRFLEKQNKVLLIYGFKLNLVVFAENVVHQHHALQSHSRVPIAYNKRAT